MNICRSRKIAQSYSKKEKQRLVSNFVAVEWSLDLFKKRSTKVAFVEEI